MWMNEWDIEEALVRFNQGKTPNLGKAALALARLANWTNRNSDGWPYWQKPSRAAKSLMELLTEANRAGRMIGEPVDITEAQLKKVMVPIKSFLTRQKVAHEDVLGSLAK